MQLVYAQSPQHFMHSFTEVSAIGHVCVCLLSFCWFSILCTTFISLFEFADSCFPFFPFFALLSFLCLCLRLVFCWFSILCTTLISLFVFAARILLVFHSLHFFHFFESPNILNTINGSGDITLLHAFIH